MATIPVRVSIGYPVRHTSALHRPGAAGLHGIEVPPWLANLRSRLLAEDFKDDGGVLGAKREGASPEVGASFFRKRVRSLEEARKLLERMVDELDLRAEPGLSVLIFDGKSPAASMQMLESVISNEMPERPEVPGDGPGPSSMN